MCTLLKPVVESWAKDRRGVRCGEGPRLSHVIYADNVVLLARSLTEQRSILPKQRWP